MDWTGGEIVHARLFGTDELDDAAEFAAAVNAGTGCSVYVGMALRKPSTSPATSAQARRISWRPPWSGPTLTRTMPFARRRRNAVHTLMPTFAIYSGRHPHKRIQLFWRLSETIAETGELRRILVAMAKALDGDPKVADPARVMRLAGSIAWPHKAGRIAEMTGILNLRDPGPPQYLPDEIRKAFPPGASVVDFEEEKARRQDDASEATSQRWGKDLGRPRVEMTRWIWGVVVDWYRESPIQPIATQQRGEMRRNRGRRSKQTITTKDPDKTLDEEGRGEALFRYKWNRAMRQWDTKVAEAAAARTAGNGIGRRRVCGRPDRAGRRHRAARLSRHIFRSAIARECSPAWRSKPCTYACAADGMRPGGNRHVMSRGSLSGYSRHRPPAHEAP